MPGVITSTAPAWKAAILASLQADTNLSNWLIADGYPGDTNSSPSMYFGKTTWNNEFAPWGGPRVKRQEVYIVEMFFDVALGTQFLSQSEDLAMSGLGELDNILSDNPTQGQQAGTEEVPKTSVWKAYIKSANSRPYRDENTSGIGVLLTAQIEVTARLW